METKAKINKWNLIKLKSSCKAKETINKMKRQPMEWEKIFVNDATDKELTFKIYKHRAAAPVWGFSREMMGSSGSLSCGAREA